jgi:hypothetical protein
MSDYTIRALTDVPDTSKGNTPERCDSSPITSRPSRSRSPTD